MRVHRYVLPLVLIASLLGSVLVAKATGYWSTSGKTAVLLDESGLADPQSIKGWMTLADVAETFHVPESELRTRLGLPADLPMDTALKDIEAIVSGFEVSAVRDVVAAYRSELAGATPSPANGSPEATPIGNPETILPSTEGIKGKDTLADVAATYGVPVDEIIAAAGLPADVDIHALLKDIADKYGVEILTIREAVSSVLAGRQGP